jgi:hypothetical protein
MDTAFCDRLKIDYKFLFTQMLNMSEVCRNTLEPTSLVMRHCSCFYCGAESTGVVLIDWLFGMKVCGQHEKQAERDCRAYLHRHNLVQLNDAFNILSLKKFLEVLKSHSHLCVERSDGTFEEDWCLRIGNIMEQAFLSCSSQQRWCVPMYNKRLNLNKSVPFISFLQKEINGGMMLPADWSAIIEGAIDTLTEGVYRAEAEAYDYARNHDESETITETAGVATIVYDGREERIYIGHLIDEAQQAITQSRPREDGTDRTEEIGDPTGEV